MNLYFDSVADIWTNQSNEPVFIERIYVGNLWIIEHFGRLMPGDTIHANISESIRLDRS